MIHTKLQFSPFYNFRENHSSETAHLFANLLFEFPLPAVFKGTIHHLPDDIPHNCQPPDHPNDPLMVALHLSLKQSKSLQILISKIVFLWKL